MTASDRLYCQLIITFKQNTLRPIKTHSDSNSHNLPSLSLHTFHQSPYHSRTIPLYQQFMKSLKYSSLSKIKKQKQEEKAQSSVLNTLKEEDEICSNLLDTLSEDYLGYLEQLMGKKSTQVTGNKNKGHVSNMKIQQQKQDDDCSKEIDGTVMFDFTQQDLQKHTKRQQLIPQKDENIINDKKLHANLQQTPSIADKLKILTIQQGKINEIYPIISKESKQSLDLQAIQNHNQINKFDINKEKQATSKNYRQALPPPILQNKQKQAKREDKSHNNCVKVKYNKDKKDSTKIVGNQDNKLINNIEGYLQSLSGIKPHLKTPLQSQKQNLNQIKNADRGKKKRKSAKLEQQQKNCLEQPQRPQRLTLIQKKLPHQNKNQSIMFSDDQFSHYVPKKSSSHTHQDPSLVFQEQNAEDSSDSEKSSSLNSIPRENQSSSQQGQDQSNHRNHKHHLKQYNYNDIEKYNSKNQTTKGSPGKLSKVAKNQKFSNYQSLQHLLIKIITKYNKLLTKHNKYKNKLREVSNQNLQLLKQNQRKDIEITTLKKISLEYLTNVKSKNNPKLMNHHDFELQKENSQQNPYKINQRKDIMTEDDQNSLLKNLDFRKKYKQNSGKNINIQKMFIVDNMQDRPKRQSHNDTHKMNQVQDFDIIRLKNQKGRKSYKQKRSNSCRQTVSKSYQPSLNKNINCIEGQHIHEKINKQREKTSTNYNFTQTFQNENYKMPPKYGMPLPKHQSAQIKRKKPLYENFQTQDEDRFKYKNTNDYLSEAAQSSGRKKDLSFSRQNLKSVKFSEKTTLGFKDDENLKEEMSKRTDTRERVFSQSYNSLSFKRKQINDLKYKFFKDQNNEKQLPAKPHWRNKFIQRQKEYSSQSQSDQHIKQNLQYFAKNIRGFSNTGDYFKLQHPSMHNEESQSTDSELLEKLLSIQKNSNTYQGKIYQNNALYR